MLGIQTTRSSSEPWVGVTRFTILNQGRERSLSEPWVDVTRFTILNKCESQLNRDVRLDGKIICSIAFSVVHLTFTSFITAALTLNDFGIFKMLWICAVLLVVQLSLPRKSWDEASGGTSSEKKLFHKVTSGVHFAVPHLRTVVITPVIHNCMGGWRLMVSALEAFARGPQEVEDQCLGRVGSSAGRNGDY